MLTVWLVVEVTDYLYWGEMNMVYTSKIWWSDQISTATCIFSFGEKQAGKVLKNSQSKRRKSSMYKYLWRTDMRKTIQDTFLIKKLLRNRQKKLWLEIQEFKNSFNTCSTFSKNHKNSVLVKKSGKCLVVLNIVFFGVLDP